MTQVIELASFPDVAAGAKAGGREAQRRATHERLFAAAVAEFERAGSAAADVGAIVRAAGVAHGTFFSHFPTKEHVVAELGQREEVRMAAELDAFLAAPRGLTELFAVVTGMAVSLEERIGTLLFRDLLALYFSPSRPELRLWPEHPVVARVIAEVGSARDRGEIDAAADPSNSATVFLLGLYALLLTQENNAARADALDQFATTVLRGLEPR
ncbi:TetR/AcrR family transcriptional regulator [Frankia sp. CcI49]|uniref:TetR/AcrR family transcriptional regulator n=1 Tax=Frankia sp. CcI49 TaxID=1745382 RepID=UPI001F51C96E|nr:TetR/AcrR family transcriptional regulator [Frankia sp. CcI49]